jgi:hypothetical protein
VIGRAYNWQGMWLAGSGLKIKKAAAFFKLGREESKQVVLS